MKSMPAWSAMRASFRQSGQLADHRSGTVVAERPDEQLAPKMPIFSALALYIAARSGNDPVRLNMAVPGVGNVPENFTPSFWRVEWGPALLKHRRQHAVRWLMPV